MSTHPQKSKRGKPTACVCGRPGFVWRSSGWICQRCNDIENQEGDKIKKTQKRHGRPELLKYYAAYTHHAKGIA